MKISILMIILFNYVSWCKTIYRYITNDFLNCYNIFCDGSIKNPYDSFVFALNDLQIIDNELYNFKFIGNSDDSH